MNVDNYIKEAVASLEPSYLELLNESHMHAGPATDSHFKLTLVSEAFAGKRAVARHQMIYGLVGEALQGPLHALALHLYTPEEWAVTDAVPASPQCAGKH
ncbi:BolA family protein [Oceanobacter mangrovi]|uniref:BolA family protein n=1 Tax=Oceanobacter mangrovi TaxID=2862510 RepID=UPI001C8EA568|nr:BolA family protein [Oceanobacter mangrovi]